MYTVTVSLSKYLVQIQMSTANTPTSASDDAAEREGGACQLRVPVWMANDAVPQR
jgi:hypothetical protein